jgi:large repetitive protein
MRPRRKPRRSHFAPQLAIERLEERTLLTGNVVAHVVAGNLFISGDNKNNEIALQSTTGGALQLSSLDGTTTINGGSGPFTTSSVTGGVVITFGSGNDVLQVGGSSTVTSLPHGLLIILGNGSDQVQIENTSIGGSVTILGGNGGDTIAVGSPSTTSDVSIGGSLGIFGGNGADTIAVFDADIAYNLIMTDGNGDDHLQVGFDEGLGIIGENESATGHVNVGQNLWIMVGNGLDHIAVADVDVTGNLDVLCGNGSDEVLLGAAHTPDTDTSPFTSLVYGQVTVGNNLSVALAGPCDPFGPLFIEGELGGPPSAFSFSVGQWCNDAPAWCGTVCQWWGEGACGGTGPTAGAEANTLVLGDVTVNGNTSITAMAGDNQIAVLDGPAFSGTFTIVTGGGNDSIVLASSGFVGKVSIFSGNGTDTIGLAQNYFQSSVTITGGSGDDTLLQAQNQPGFVNTYMAGSPTVTSITNNLPDETPTQIEAAFAWLTGLLGL